MLKQTVAAAFSLALGAATLPALADTHITYVDDQGKVATQIFVKGGKVRMESGDSAGRGVALYDVATNTMMVLMPSEKKYLVYDSTSAAQLGAQADAAQAKLAQHQAEMDQANQQMEAAMANMTPEQKAMMQQALAQRAGATPSAAGGGIQTETKELGTSEIVAGHSCKDVQLLVNGKPSATLCVIGSPSSLGIPSGDLKTLQAMRDGMQKLVSKMGPMGQGMSAMMGSGFSLKSTRQSYRNFQPVSETDTFKAVSSASLETSMFQVPSGYTQTTMQELMQGGHQ